MLGFLKRYYVTYRYYVKVFQSAHDGKPEVVKSIDLGLGRGRKVDQQVKVLVVKPD